MKQYYYVTEADEQVGPVTMEQLRAAGIKRDTLVWSEGMADWADAEQLPELAELFAAPSLCPPPLPHRRTAVDISNSEGQTAMVADDDVPPAIPITHSATASREEANDVPPAVPNPHGGNHPSAPAQHKRNPVYLVFAGIFFFVLLGITLFSALSLHNQRIEDENATVVVDPEEMTTFERLEAQGYEYAGTITAYFVGYNYSYNQSYYWKTSSDYQLFVKNNDAYPVYALLDIYRDEKYYMYDWKTPVRCDEGYYDENGNNYKRFNYHLNNHYFCIE